METNENKLDDRATVEKIQSRLQDFNAKLDAIDKQLDAKHDNLAEEPKENISYEEIQDDINAYKKAVNELKETRMRISRYANQQESDEVFSGLAEIRQMIELLSEMKANSDDLIHQCDYLKETKESLREIGDNAKLFQVMDTLRERMVDLGGCDEKIKTAAETAMKRVSTMEEVLDKRLVDMSHLETELLDSGKILRQTADNIDAIIKTASEGSIQDLHNAMGQIQKDIHMQIDSMNQSVKSLIKTTSENTNRIDNLAQSGDAYKQLKDMMGKINQIREVLNNKTYQDDFEKIRKSQELQRFSAMLRRRLNDDELEDAYAIMKLLVNTCNAGHKMYKTVLNMVTS